MKLLVALAALALTLTTGFTCSKNTPEVAKTEAPAQENTEAGQNQPSQEQMAQPPAESAPTAPQPEEAAQPEGESK